MSNITKNAQVIYRRELQSGLKQICIGTVLSFSSDGTKANVSFPAEQVHRTVPVNQLQVASAAASGRVRVELNPVRRLVDFLR